MSLNNYMPPENNFKKYRIVAPTYSVKKVFLEMSENTCARAYVNKVAGTGVFL